MKKNLLFNIAALVALLAVACTKEPAVKISMHLPEAAFTFEAAEKTITFTNSSVNATSYLWDFGDGETSTEESPVHTYTVESRYNVTLTAMDDKENQSVLKQSVNAGFQPEPVNITLDGDFADWDAVPESMLAGCTLDEVAKPVYTALKEVKYCADLQYIYVYLKMDKSEAHELTFHMNSDSDEETGYITGLWANLGSDYRVCGTFSNDFNLGVQEYCTDDAFKNDAKYGQWDGWGKGRWTALDGTFEKSDYKTVEGDIIEFEGRIIREYLPVLDMKTYIGVRLANKGWSTNGLLPASPDGDGTARAIEVLIP